MVDVYVASEDGVLPHLLTDAYNYAEFFGEINFIELSNNDEDIVLTEGIIMIDKIISKEKISDIFASKNIIIKASSDEDALEFDKKSKIIILRKPYRIEEVNFAIRNAIDLREYQKLNSINFESEVDSKIAAQTDYLTGLPNRRGLYEHFNWTKKEQKIHCMFLDIDNFKKVNDTYGHKTGDKLLQNVSHMVKEKIEGAFIARMGGDEFAVVIDGSMDREHVIMIAQSILDSVDEIEQSMDISSLISFSIGIIFDQSLKGDLEEILLKCDVAMYQAKKSGKNKYIIYNSIEEKFAYKMSVNREKKNALLEDRFKLFFRPRMNMITSGIEGAETRIFWDHPVDGLRNPREFMDILEEDNFIIELEMHMFRKLCALLNDYKNTPLNDLNIHYKMSKRHLIYWDFANKLKSIVRENNLKTERFFIGISEADKSEKALGNIAALVEAGFNISYSRSVNNIGVSLLDSKDNNASEWVIDSELTSSMLNSRSSATIIKSVISLAKDLNIQVVARGVEDKRTTDYLTNYGCFVGIGDYFSKPLDVEEFLNFGLSNIQNSNNTYIFDFNDGMQEKNSAFTARFIDKIHNRCSFSWDSKLERQVLRFPGSELPLDNAVEIPTNLMQTKNYTVSVFIKVEEFNQWTSVFYVGYSNGFMSIMPSAWDSSAMFRVKDSLYEDEWHDAVGKSLVENTWYYITVTYNSKKSESRIYIDGELAGQRDKVHTIEEPIQVILGGDIFTSSFKGDIARLEIYDHVLSMEEIGKAYNNLFDKLT